MALEALEVLSEAHNQDLAKSRSRTPDQVGGGPFDLKRSTAHAVVLVNNVSRRSDVNPSSRLFHTQYFPL